MRPCQSQAFKYTLTRDASALFLEMRLGKTLVTIRSVDFKEAYPCLVVAPLSAFYGWISELHEEGFDDSDIVVVTGTNSDKRYAKLAEGIERGARWFLINKEGHRAVPEIADLNWCCLVLDESPFIKSPSTQVTKFYLRYFSEVPQRYILTGTPAPESILDYYTQLCFLDPDTFPDRDYWQWRFRLFKVTGYQWHCTRSGHAEIQKALAERCFFMTRKQAGYTEEFTVVRRTLSLPPKYRKLYRTIEEEFVVDDEDLELRMTKWATTRHIWLRQLCGGHVDGELVYDGKVKEVMYLAGGELRGQRLVIWANFTAEIDSLYARLSGKYGKQKVAYIDGRVKLRDRMQIQDGFRKGDIPYVICQPECAKHGVDFSAASVAIFYSVPQGYDAYRQPRDRVVKIGKHDNLFVIFLVVEDEGGTVDEDAVESINAKENSQAVYRRFIARRKAKLCQAA
jgi:SNF2 family DNA or RNA helicase